MRMFAIVTSVVLCFGCAPEADEAVETETNAVEETIAETTQTPVGETEITKGPCSVITEAEAGQALGQPVRYRSTVDEGGSNCIVDGVDDEMVSVDFTVWQVDPDSGRVQIVEALLVLADEIRGLEQVEGLGDRALWDPSMQMIMVEKGSRILRATFSGLDASAKDRAIDFAREIVEEM